MDEQPSVSSRSTVLPVLTAAALLGGWAYWPSLAEIAETWNSDPDYTHGYFVVPLAIAFLWTRRSSMPPLALSFSAGGAGLLLAAALMRWSAARFYLPQIDAWSVPIWLGGIIWLTFGWKTFRWSSPSVFFLWFATPMPDTINLLISQPLQKVAAQSGSAILHLLGQPAVVEGTTILVDDQVLDVVRACSGLRMFYGIAALAVAFVIFQKMPRWNAAIMLAAVAPVAIVANAMRLAATAIWLQFASDEAAEKFAHDMAGFAIVPIAVVMFAGVQWIVGVYGRKTKDQPASKVFSMAIKHGLIVTVLIGVLSAWKIYQANRAIGTLLRTAERLENEGEWARAIYFLDRYLRAYPDDEEVRMRVLKDFGEATDHQPSLRYLTLHQQTWTRLPNRIDVGLEAARQALKLGEFPVALELADKLRKHAPNDAEASATADHVSALAMSYALASGRGAAGYTWEQAAGELEQAIESNPDEYIYHAILAEKYREHSPDQDRTKDAEKQIADMVEKHSDSALAWLAHYRYLLRYPDPNVPEEEREQQSDQSLDRAIELLDENPKLDDLEILISAASRAIARDEQDIAVGYLEQAITIAPKDSRSYLQLAQLYRERETEEGIAKAIQTLEKAEAIPEAATIVVVSSLASDLVSAGRFDDAEARLKTIEGLQARFTDQGVRALVTLLIQDVLAQLQFKKDGVEAAADLLRVALADHADLAARANSRFVARSLRRLGYYAELQGNYDQAADAYLKAGEFDPNTAQWSERAAQAMLATGNVDTARQLLQERVDQGKADSATLLALIRSELATQLLAPTSQRNFGNCQRLLSVAKDRGVSMTDVATLQTQILMAQGKTDEALELLRASLEETADSPQLLEVLANVYANRNEPGDERFALLAVERAAQAAKDPKRGIQLKAAILTRMGKADEAADLLQQQLASLTGTDRSMLTMQLAGLKWSQGQTDDARQLLKDARAEDTENKQLVELAAEYEWAAALATKDLAEVEALLKPLQDVGSGLANWYKARTLIAQATSRTDQGLLEAVELAQGLAAKRPSWPKTHVLLGELYARQGAAAKALAAYTQAWTLGERNVAVADSILALLASTQQTDQARAFVAEIQDHLATSSRLFDRSLPFLQDATTRNEALATARQWKDANPDDGEALARFGRVKMILAKDDKEQEEVAKIFERAIALAPKSRAVWMSSIDHARRHLGTEAAVAKIEAFEATVEGDPVDRAFVTAQLMATLPANTVSLAKTGRAFRRLEALVASAEQEQPEELAARQKKAQFHLLLARYYESRSATLALIHYRTAEQLVPEAAELRLVRIAALLGTGEDTHEQEARKIWASHLKSAAERKTPLSDDAPMNAAELRLQATLALRANNSEQLQSAAAGLEKMAVTRQDQSLLAACYEALNRPNAALDILTGLADAAEALPADQSQLARFWIKHFSKDEDQAEATEFLKDRAVERLKRAPGQSSLVLHLELLESEALETPWSDDVLAKRVANIGETEPALLAADVTPEQRRAVFLSALRVLTQHKRSEQAVALCATPPAWISKTDAAMALCLLLTGGSLEESTLKSAHAVVADAIEADATATPLLRLAADVFYLNRLYPESIAFFEKMVHSEDAELATKNNYALVLAEQADRQADALAQMDALLASDEATPELIDSKASVLMAMGRDDEARSLLAQLREDGYETAATHLHEAWLHHQAGQKELAEQHWRDAISMGLSTQVLAPRDRDAADVLGAEIQL